MTKKTIVIKKQTIVFSIIVISISIFVFIRYNALSSELQNVSSENEQLIEQEEELKNQIEEIEDAQQNKLIEEQNREIRQQKARQIEIDKKQVIATKLSKYMLANLTNTYDIRIDMKKRLLYLDNKIMPLDKIYAHYSYIDTQPKFGYDYIGFRCLDDSHCIKYDGTGAIAFTLPVSSKYVAERIAEDLSKL
tara:strand:- start:307 stop:882 length:576 start_codon:yes stop_codon:yes gene_type:complete